MRKFINLIEDVMTLLNMMLAGIIAIISSICDFIGLVGIGLVLDRLGLTIISMTKKGRRSIIDSLYYGYEKSLDTLERAEREYYTRD